MTKSDHKSPMNFISAPQNALTCRRNLSVVALAPLLTRSFKVARPTQETIFDENMSSMQKF